jgi:hypothetical protein
VCFYGGRIKFYTLYPSYLGKTYKRNIYKNHAGSMFHYFGPNLKRFVGVFGELAGVK